MLQHAPALEEVQEVVAGVRQDHPQARGGLQQHRLQDLQARRIHEVHGRAVQHQVPDQALLASLLQVQCSTTITQLCPRKLPSSCQCECKCLPERECSALQQSGDGVCMKRSAS